MKHQRTTGLVLTLLAIMASGPVCAQAWNYQTYNAGGPSLMGQITLDEQGGEAKFQMQASSLDTCYRSVLKASVERTASTITITPVPRINGCEQVRFVLKADGTGGYREMLNNGEWRREQTNRVLTIRN